MPRSTLADARSEPIAAELAAKQALLRATLERHQLAGVRLRGQDWFAWATGGGSNAVLLATDRGVAEVLITADRTCVLTDAIERARLVAEEVPPGFEVVEFPWARPDEREDFVRTACGDGPVASDQPADTEARLPRALQAARLRLQSTEIERYRRISRGAAEAMTEAMMGATPRMSELALAGAGAEALLRRGIEPALILVAGATRVARYRHPRPTREPIGDRAMMVFCGRRYGLYANLTRWVYFRAPTGGERARNDAVAHVESVAWSASRPGAGLGEVFEAIVGAYAQLGHAAAELDHHQGGTTGYLSRETIATPGDSTVIEPDSALAWNPSLPGAKIEDTVLCSEQGLEVLTADPAWPTVDVGGRARPDLLLRP